MTRTRYLIASLLRTFGVTRKNKRLTDAAYEMHLMQDGEEILGAFCWPQTEPIEDLETAYWNLRRLEKEKQEILSKVRKAEDILGGAHQQKFKAITSSREKESPFNDTILSLNTKIKEFTIDHDACASRALAIKKRHGALKMKLQVLQNERGKNEAEVQECLKTLASLRQAFMEEKDALAAAKRRIVAAKEELDNFREGASKSLQESNAETSEAYSRISQANKDITHHRAKLALIEDEQAVLYREVGHFLNLNARRRDCQNACRQHRAILSQIQLLQASIRRNRALAEQG